MKDRFVLKYSQRASKPEPQGVSESGGVMKRPIATKNRPLHDHRANDALLEYLDNLED